MGPAVHGVVAPQHSTRGITATQAQARFVGRPMGPRPALHGHNHPLAIARVATVMELARLLGWLDADDFQASPEATLEHLTGFHTRPYLAALRRADALQQVEPAVRRVPDAAAAPGIRGTGRAPEPAGSISATDTAHADPVAGRATTAADAPHIDLSVHTVAGLPGFTALDVPGYAPRDARQVHLAFGKRVIGTPCGAWWAVQADISGEWLVAPTVHVKPISDVLQEVLESSGPWLRLDMGMRVGFGTNWRPTAHAGVGLQAHLRNTEKRSNNLTLPGDDVQTSSERTILFGGAFVLGMGFEYRTDDVLLGVDVQIRQGVAADYRSVAVLLFLGYFLDRGR